MLKHLDKLDSLRLKNDGLYERQETRLVKRLLKPKQVFVDIGAHIGYYTVMAAEIGCEVYAFEPNPESFLLLHENTKDMENVHLHNLALSNRDGKTKLYLNENNTGDHRMFEVEGRESVEVLASRLDNCDIPKANFLKMDVQGFECHVLRGAVNLIEHSPDLQMLIEYSPNHLQEAGASPGKLIGMLLDLKFFIYVKNGKGLWFYADSADLHIVTKKHTNLFCSHLRHELINWSDT